MSIENFYEPEQDENESSSAYDQYNFTELAEKLRNSSSYINVLKQQIAEEPQGNEEQTKAKFKRLKEMYYKAKTEGELKE